MTRVTLLHNPGAGDEEHSKKELLSLMKQNGFDCRYLSTKEKGWKDFTAGSGFLAIAGGDGTVRQAIKQIIEDKESRHIRPIALLPFGTANNIASSLGIKGSAADIISSWRKPVTKKIDVGRITNLPEAEFFIEGIGFGLFPSMVKKRFGQGDDLHPEERLKKDLQVLYELIFSYQPVFCKLSIDGVYRSGKFLLVEIMNIKAIGPGLNLSPHADPGDGEMEIILLPASHAQRFAHYILDKINGKEIIPQFDTLKGKEIMVHWEGSDMHVDDQMIGIDSTAEITIGIKSSFLEFMVPG